jgi:hypothetical protein
MKIEKHIPPPPAVSRVHLTILPKMEPGDSIQVTESKATVISAVYAYAKRTKKKFASKTVNGITRVWRIK